jgi:hypothetical protein
LTFDRRRVDVRTVYLAEGLTLLPGEDEDERAGAAGNRTRSRDPVVPFDCGVLVEAAGAGRDSVIRNRPDSGYWPKTTNSQLASR